MLIPLTPFLWSFIQVTMLVSIALLVSWSLRGRVPQWTSAMLASCSLAALGLTAIAWLPVSHWSMTSVIPAPSPSMPISAEPKQDPASIQSLDSSMQEPANHDSSIESDDSTGTVSAASISLTNWIASTSSWLKFGVSSIDNELRSLEPTSAEDRYHLSRLQIIPLIVLGVLASLWLLSWCWIRSIVRGSHPIQDPALVVRLEQLAERMQVKRLPALLESDRIAVGATIGHWRGRLVLSRGWRQWSADELDAVILHELAHMLRHDYAWVVVSSWIRVLLFFHPLIHCSFVV